MLLAASAAAAEVQTREIEYKEGEAVLQGLITWDDATKGLRPGVLVVHEWWGHNPDAGKAGMDALEYNAEADQKSWAAMLELFKEVFH